MAMDEGPRLSRRGARRRRPEEREEGPKQPEPAAPSMGSHAASLARRTRSHKAALLMATLPAAALLLLVAAPGGRAFVPPVQHQHQQPRERHRPDATVRLSAEIFGASSSSSQPTGGSSPQCPAASLTSPPPAAAAAVTPAAGATAAEAGSSPRRRSRPDQSLLLEGLSHLEPAGGAAPQQFEQLQDRQEQKRPLQQPSPHADEILGGSLAQVLAEELPGLCLASVLEKAPLQRLLQAQTGVDVGACQRRLRALKAALPGGVNVTHAVVEVPRLLSYYGWYAPAMEAAVGPRFRALCEATGTAADAAEIVNRFPRVLLRDFDARVKPHLEALTELLPGADAAYLLRKHPAVLGKSVAAHLRPRIQQHLPALFPADTLESGSSSSGSDEAAADGNGHQGQQQHVGVGSLAVTYPELLTAPLGPLRERVAALTQLLPPGLLLPTLSLHARAWTADLSEEVGPQVRLLRARLGEETARAVLLNLPSAMYHTPGALARRLDVLEALLGAEDAHAVLALNPMILAVDAAAHVAPKVRYLHALFDPELVDDARFRAMLATEAGAKCLTSAFGRLGRLSYLLQVQPTLDLASGLKLCVISSEELRRRYPGYENFLEDRIEPRFPNYTWEQLCALPFAMREQAHGEILHRLYSLPGGEGGKGEEGEDGGGPGFFEPIDPLALLDDEPALAGAEDDGAR